MNARRPRKTADQWARIVKQHEASGLTIKAFCEQHGYALATFSKWHRRAHQKPVSSKPAFKPVQTAESKPTAAVTPAASLITLKVGGHVTLTIETENRVT